MRTSEISRYREQLEEQLAELAEHATGKVEEMVDERDGLPDPNDRATREAEIENTLRLRDRDRKLIAKIQSALRRIDEGTFGLCTACGEPIPQDRLRARPVTEMCIECKREAERLERNV